MTNTMRLRFWGVRGTLPTPGFHKAAFGGRTACVELNCGDHTLIFDAGTGIAVLDKHFTKADILLSHTHIDHVLGLPFFLLDCRKSLHIDIWAGHLAPEYSLQGTISTLMSAPLFPIPLDAVKPNVAFHDFRAGEALFKPEWEAAGIRVTTMALHHPDRATGYRVEYRGKSVCYITDYEHTEGDIEPALVAFVKNADVLIYDSTYTDESFAKHIGWGHSTWEQGLRLADHAGVKRFVAFHHDPLADDASLRVREESLQEIRPDSFFAQENMVLHLLPEESVYMAKWNSHLDPRDAVQLVEQLTAIGVSLSAEDNLDHLLEIILVEAQKIANADGGTIYLRQDDELTFALARNNTLKIAYGGSSGVEAPFAPLPLVHHDSEHVSQRTIAAYVVLHKEAVNIEDAYHAEGFNFEGAKIFDRQHGYRTQSVLTIPMVTHKGEALGCLQLINARGAKGEVIPFSPPVEKLIQSLASQATIILHNKTLMQAQKDLLEAFIKMIAQAIDAKSHYTGAHCERVPTLTNMLAQAACDATEGVFKDFAMSAEEKYELHIAGWMHDCGKVATPVHIMDKSTKLETINDRIALIQTRFELLKRDAKIAMLEACMEPRADRLALEKHYAQKVAQIDDDFAFIAKANIGGEFMSDADLARLEAIAAQRWHSMGAEQRGLTEEELYNLSIRRGTLTKEERTIMNDHMVHTCAMLEALPFPKHLKRVPEFAGGHHERMDGKGYPKGLRAGEMSIPARMMAVADVFEALTANDRPYKPAKKLSEAMTIIGQMKRQHHLDPVMVDFFVTSKVYLDFARRYLDESLIDAVDEAALLAIVPE